MRRRSVIPTLAGFLLALSPIAPAAAAPPEPAPIARDAAALEDEAALLDAQLRSARSASRLQDALSTSAMLGGLFGLFAAGTLAIGAADPRLRVRRRR